MRRVITGLEVLFVTALILIPGQALAIDRQLLLGADLSYAHEWGDQSRPGGGASVHAQYFINDYVAVGGAIGWAGHAATDDAGESTLRNVITAAAGLYYFADIIRIVPYAGVLVGAAVSIQDETEAAYLLQICGGGYVLVNAAFTLGAELSYQMLVGEELLPARLVASITLNWRHIFF